MPFDPRHARSVILLCLLGLCWGSGYAIARAAMTRGMPPLSYAFWQAFGPALLLTLCSCFRGGLPKLSWTHLRYFLFCGIVGLAIPNTNMYWVASQVPSGLLALLVNTVPLWSCILVFLLSPKKPSAFQGLGLAVGVTGLLLLVLPGAHSLAPLHLMLQVLISPVCFAICAYWIERQAPQSLNILQQSMGMLWVATACASILLRYEGQTPVLLSLEPSIQQLVLLEILLSSAGYLLFFLLLQQAGALYYSLVGGVVALVGLLWGRIIFGEAWPSVAWLATLCILFGILVVHDQGLRFPRRKGAQGG